MLRRPWADVAALDDETEESIEHLRIAASTEEMLDPKESESDNEVERIRKELSEFPEIQRKFEASELSSSISNLEESWNWLMNLHSVVRQMVTGVDEGRKRLSSLSEAKDEVFRMTSGLSVQCEEVIQRKQIKESEIRLAEEYLDRYERIPTLKAEAATAEFAINSDSFCRIIEAVEDGISFFKKNNKFVLAGKSLQQYEGLRQQATQSLRVVMSQALEKCEKDAEANKVGELDSNLLYVRFRAVGSAMKPTISVLARRADGGGDAEEFFSKSMDQLEGIYVATRMRLVCPAVKGRLRALSVSDANSEDLAVVARRSTSFMLALCQMEIVAYESYFEPRSNKDSLRLLLESFGTIYYDELRPPVLLCKSIHILREIATGLSLDVLDVQGSKQEGKSGGVFRPELSPFIAIVFRLHRDVQERLLFRCSEFIRTDIKGFRPSKAELDYPRRRIEALTEKMSSGFLRKDCYPSLKSTIMTLAEVIPVLHADSFNTVAQDAVTATLESLMDASIRIGETKKSPGDGQLFLIHQLLLLREQVACLGTQLVRKERFVDISHLKANLWDLLTLNRSGKLQLHSAASLLRNFAPVLQEIRVDTNKALENILGHACEDFIKDGTSQIAWPLLRVQWAAEEAAVRLAALREAERPAALRQVPALSEGALMEEIQKFWMQLCKHAPTLLHRLHAYLSPSPIEEVPKLPLGWQQWLESQSEEVVGSREFSSSTSAEMPKSQSEAEEDTPGGDEADATLEAKQTLARSKRHTQYLSYEVEQCKSVVMLEDRQDPVCAMMRPVILGILQVVQAVHTILCNRLRLVESELDAIRWQSIAVVDAVFCHLLEQCQDCKTQDAESLWTPRGGDGELEADDDAFDLTPAVEPTGRSESFDAEKTLVV